MPDQAAAVSSDSAPAFGVRRITDVPFARTGDAPLLADLYLPEGLPHRAPVILWLHGGAWRFGDRRLAPDLERYYARRGFAIVSIDYRLSTQAVFPAAIEDVKTAIRWVRSVAETYDLDPCNIGLWGSSSGGHLAALAATSGPGAFESMASPYAHHSSDVQAVVDGYGPVDFLQMDAQRDPAAPPSEDPETVALPPGLRSADAASPESLFLGGAIEDHPDRARRANPITYVAGGQPPFLILHGLSDPAVPHQQSGLLFDALHRTNNDVTLALIEHLGHGFLNRSHLDDGGPWTMQIRRPGPDGAVETTATQAAIFQMIEDFFRRHLGSGF